MAIDLRQKELAGWAKKNFGEQTTDDNVFGMVEELGEFCHILLKRKQGIRGYVGNPKKTEDMIGDAFSDLVIFAIQAMSSEGLDAEAYLTKTIDDVLKRDWKKDPLNGSEHHRDKVDR